MMEYCAYCGEPVESDYKFCPSCGEYIGDVEEFLMSKYDDDDEDDEPTESDEEDDSDEIQNTSDAISPHTFASNSSNNLICPECGAILTDENVLDGYDNLMECPECGNIFPLNEQPLSSPEAKATEAIEQKYPKQNKCYICGEPPDPDKKLIPVMSEAGLKYLCKSCWEDLANSESNPFSLMGDSSYL